MSPIDAIIWVCVFVFAGTATITLMYLCGFKFLQIPKEHVPKLVQVLIVQIATASVGAFGYYAFTKAREPGTGRLPVDSLLVVEQADPQEVFDGMKALYISSPDVKLCFRGNDSEGPTAKCEGQFATLRFARTREMAGAAELRLAPGETKTIEVDAAKYQVSYRLIGKLAPNPHEAQSHDRDFVMLHVTK